MNKCAIDFSSYLIAACFLFQTSCGQAGDCSVEAITDNNNSVDEINKNFKCLENKLSDLDQKLEKILSAVESGFRNGPEITNENGNTDNWSVTIGDVQIAIKRAVVSRLPSGAVQIVAEWRIINHSGNNMMTMVSYGRDTTMTITGEQALKARISGITTCNTRVDACASQDFSKWTIIPPGQTHSFSTSLIKRRNTNTTGLFLNVNAKLLLHDQQNWVVRDVSFSDIPISP